MLGCNSMSDGVGGGPGGLEVEATGDAVDIEHFACEKEVGNVAAFKRGVVDGL